MEINLLLLTISLVYLLFYIGCWIYVVDQDSDVMLGVIAWSTVIGGTLILLGGLVAGLKGPKAVTIQTS